MREWPQMLTVHTSRMSTRTHSSGTPAADSEWEVGSCFGLEPTALLAWQEAPMNRKRGVERAMKATPVLHPFLSTPETNGQKLPELMRTTYKP